MELSGFFRTKSSAARHDPQPAEPGEAHVITAEDGAARLAVLDDFEHAGIGWIWAADPEGRLIYVSPSATEHLDLVAADLLGKPLLQLFETDPDNPDQGSDRPLKFQLSARNRLKDLVVRLVPASREGQRSTWWSISAHPKTSKSGKFEG